MTRPASPTRPRAAFTLVELLVVIAVVGVLMGVLLPALAGARSHAIGMRDANGLRQTLLAWQGFAADHDDRLLVGKYRFDAPDAEIYDGYGATVAMTEARVRYPLRLVTYLDEGLRGTVILGERESLLEDIPESGTTERDFWQYHLSVFPSFGINASFVGGHEVLVPGDAGYPGQTPFRVARRFSEIVQPATQLVFASSRGEDWSVKEGGMIRADGWYTVEAPNLNIPYIIAAGDSWSEEEYDADSHPEEYGNIDARYRGKVLTGRADGHTTFETPKTLRDMRLWSGEALKKSLPDWTPPS
jgi:prepilin-type N-terminal cleavage/methylation domain-containing protein